MVKSKNNKADEINTCIACNQACLDHVFGGKDASCLVNPRAVKSIPKTRVASSRKVAVVGAGPAGLSAATELAARGFETHLFEASASIGGQFNLAKQIPGKEEFSETLRYFGKMIEKNGVFLHLNVKVDAEMLKNQQFSEVVLASGISPRRPQIEGIDHPKSVSYIDVLTKKIEVGEKVAIIGAGGIGFDLAVYVTTPPHTEPDSIQHYKEEWGIDSDYAHRGGIKQAITTASPRQVWLLQRSKGKMGDKLGKTTGWAHRITLKNRKVQMWSEVQYDKIDDAGLHITVKGQPQVLAVDHVIICAGQNPLRTLQAPLQEAGIKVHLIGGAKEAGELDAKRAIEEGMVLAYEMAKA